jgi:hypothetical protein
MTLPRLPRAVVDTPDVTRLLRIGRAAAERQLSVTGDYHTEPSLPTFSLLVVRSWREASKEFTKAEGSPWPESGRGMALNSRREASRSLWLMAFLWT